MKSIKIFIWFCTITLLVSCDKKTCNCCLTYSYKLPELSANSNTSEISRIRYNSDGLEISGFIIKPKNISENEKLPLIIYNRGGNRDFGSITSDNLRYLQYLSSFGYIVMASQYRGNSFSEGIDEFGGNDVNDVKCLIEIAKRDSSIDTENIGILGFSRGGLMAYLISKQSNDFKTFVTVGAPTNLFLGSKNRPALYQEVFLDLIGDTINHRSKYIERSPVYWVKEINEPGLIIHGADDQRVSIQHSTDLLDSLAKGNNSIKHVFIEGGDHSLSKHRGKRNDLIIEWFNQHLKKNE